MTSSSDHREDERILALVRLDYTRDEIAVELDLSPNTVRRVIRSECRKRGTNLRGLRRALAVEAASA